MGNFNRGGRDSGRSDDRGGDRGGRGFSRGGFNGSKGGFSYGGAGRGGRDEDRQMFQAVCSDCGKDCEVPFKPNGSKPVLCRDCFRGSNGDDRPARRSFQREDHGGRSALGGHSGGVSQEHIDQQFAQLNEKLDKILKRLTPSHLRSKQAEENLMDTATSESDAGEAKLD